MPEAGWGLFPLAAGRPRTDRFNGTQKPMYANVTGLILAGGRSRRFGSDKARHVVGDREMIRRVFDALREVTPEVLVSAGKEARSYDVPARHVADEVVDAGPLGGLHAGLSAATRPWVLAVACDLPYLTPDVLRMLLEARSEGLSAVVARTSEGRLHPLCAAYHRSILPVASAQLSTGTYALHALLERLPSVRHETVPDEALRNVNHPSDLPGAGPQPG